MPLITRNSQNANVKLGTTAQLAAITFTDGDLASDTTLNKVKVFNGVSLTEIGATSFSSSAVVSQSTTIADYTTPTSALGSNATNDTVEYLVIGGGGGGGVTNGGGGGSGGYRTATGFSVVVQTYAITVGAGGNGAIVGSDGTNGSDSVFSTITSTGGGKGGRGTVGSSGGSGGGGGDNSAGGAGNTPSTSPSQGNNGGTSTGGAPIYPASGGGGSSSVGGNAATSIAGNGGAGTASSITGTSVTRAGGGGGGCAPAGTAGLGGTGGGGAGNFDFLTATAGTVNTGSGGGGSGSGTGSIGGAGGSGIVIIKYLTSNISATGGTMTTNGSYTIHTFNSSSSFVISAIHGGSQAVDDNTATKWTSSSSSNPNIYVDMGSALNLCAAAFYFDSTGTTNTEILIQSSPDASVWTTKRTITKSDLTDGAYNFYRFNLAAGSRYIRFYGNSGGSTVLSIWEIKILKKTDTEIFNDLGMLTITASDTALGPDGT